MPVSVRPVSMTPLELLGTSPAVEHLRALVRRAADGHESVLIELEGGLNAADIALEIHSGSNRAAARFVTYECAAPDARRVERDLFGHVGTPRSGHLKAVGETSRIADALGGTLFLSSVGDLPSSVQARLARMVRDGEAQLDPPPARVPLDVRFIASTTVDLEGEVRQGRFRRDLYNRFALRVEAPPLRHRAADIPMLVRCLAEQTCHARGMPVLRFSEEALTLLSALPWRGNLQELREVVERLMLGRRADIVRLEDALGQLRLEPAAAAFLAAGSLREARLRFERDYVAAMLQQHGWKMGEAAKALGIQRTNLYRKTRQLGIARARTR